MNNNWDTDKFDLAHLAHQVIAIHLCGCINQKNEGDKKEIHQLITGLLYWSARMPVHRTRYDA